MANPAKVTITIVNKLGYDVSTVHANRASKPTNVPEGNPGRGKIAKGKSSKFVVKKNWSGNLQINHAGNGLPDPGMSSIEANHDGGIFTINTSYLLGFSVPITCKCNNKYVTGCNADLWKANTCPAKDKHNHCCNNPRRGHPEIKTPTAFFKPCKGKAYTYEEDHDSVSYGQCQGGQVTCCLGYANTCKY